MVVTPINNDRIIIRLSNTESVSQNIFKYTSLDKSKETKSKSSTCNYFLTTSDKVADELKTILNDSGYKYFLDLEKTNTYIDKLSKIIDSNDLKNDFRGNLAAFYTAKDYYSFITKEYIDLGYGIVKLDQGGKYNLYFNNQDEEVEMFRNAVVAILSDIVIEKDNDKFVVYPIIKEKVLENDNDYIIYKIVNLAKSLESCYNDETVKKIIIEGYKLLNK